MPRFHLPPSEWKRETVLTGDEARHLSQVLRIKSGATITVFDGRGGRADAEVREVSRDHVSLLLEKTVSIPAPKPAITLVQAIPKGKNMDLIVQKAVELGVSLIQPIITRHSIVQPGEGKAEKWRRTALEACKQCGQDILPEILEPLPFQSWIRQHTSSGLSLIASLAPGAKPLREILRAHPGTASARLLIGPEGDFSPEETGAAIAADFLPVSLGNIVLRVETAAFYCISALRYEFGEDGTPDIIPTAG